MFSKMSKYTIYLPDLEKISESEIDLKEIIKDIPLVYTISREEFRNITGVRKEHLSREIKKTSKGLLSKIILTPHPLYPKDPNSIEGITWFTKITYVNSTGEICMELNKYALERLVAFVKYSKISFDNLVKLKSSYSIFTYLFLKIIKDISFNKTLTSEVLNISDFKEKLSLKNKYKDINLLKKYVLEVIKKEINEVTDLTVDYELIKEGRAFTKIKLTFDYKPEYLELQFKMKNKSSKPCQIIDDFKEDSYSPFEHVLTCWGIRAKKVVEIEENYSLDVIQSAINLTLEKEASGEIETTKAAIFMGILENKQLASDELFEREQLKIREKQEEQDKKALASEYDAIQNFINDNDEELSKYLSAKSLGTEYPLDNSIKEEVANISCVDADKYKNFRPKLAVLERGYFDSNTNKLVRPNMYNFLLSI